MNGSDKFIILVIFIALIVTGIHKFNVGDSHNFRLPDISNLSNIFRLQPKVDRAGSVEQFTKTNSKQKPINEDKNKDISDTKVVTQNVMNTTNTTYRLVRIYKPLMPEQCKKSKNRLGIINCTEQPDYWAAAVMACGGKQKMANEDELAQIANEIYDVNYIEGRTDNTTDVVQNPDKYKEYFGNEKVIGLWASNESTGRYVGHSHWRYFHKNATGWRGNGVRQNNYETNYALCK